MQRQPVLQGVSMSQNKTTIGFEQKNGVSFRIVKTPYSKCAQCQNVKNGIFVGP